VEAAEEIADEPTTDRNARTEQFLGASAVIEAAGATHPGRMRTRNEDAFEILVDVGLALVADGLGGHPAGDIASRMAVQEVADCLRDLDLDPTKPDVNDAGALPRPTMDLLQLALQHANREIHLAGRRFPVTAGMGTTIAALLVVRGFAIVAHVGDSRIYLIREGQLVPVTEDHSRAAEYARFHGPNTHPPTDGALTRCLGAWPRVDVSISAVRRAPGDTFVLCSDGLWNVVPEDAIVRIVLGAADLGEAADRLIEAANAAGGPDNITAVVVRPLAIQTLSSRPPA
jgi:serine/threonine protein phosphatase PrpC